MDKSVIDKFKTSANNLQQTLSQKDTIVDEEGIRIVIDGNQKIKEFVIEGITNSTVMEKLNKAIKLSQEIAAKALLELQSI